MAAKHTGDRTAITDAVNAIEPLIGKQEDISCGDIVPLLEAINESSDEVAPQARQFAGLIAPLIKDKEFRNRAEQIARLA